MDILITGANRGLGLSFVKTGLEKGHRIFAGLRTEASKSNPLKELQKMYAGQLHFIKLDVTNEQDVIEAVKTVQEKTSSIDVIINNAGILLDRDKTIETLHLEACETAFAVNTLGPMRIVKHFLPLLRKGKNQSIINISSDSASLAKAGTNDYPYGLSKAALNMFTQKLHLSLKEEGIRVLAIHPGWMKTDMGGEEAPLNPLDVAANIFKYLDHEKSLKIPHTFINHFGKPMDL